VYVTGYYLFNFHQKYVMAVQLPSRGRTKLRNRAHNIGAKLGAYGATELGPFPLRVVIISSGYQTFGISLPFNAFLPIVDIKDFVKSIGKVRRE